MRFNLQNRNRIPIVLFIGCLVVAPSSFYSIPPESRLAVTVSLLTMIGGVAAFLYSTHAADLKLFRELFTEFNTRYDRINERLNEIHLRPTGQALNVDDVKILYDYFNLCAEEYMYHISGCIDNRIWQAWQSGMEHFASDPEIRTLWKSELKSGSYYGFKLQKLETE